MSRSKIEGTAMLRSTDEENLLAPSGNREKEEAYIVELKRLMDELMPTDIQISRGIMKLGFFL